MNLMIEDAYGTVIASRLSPLASPASPRQMDRTMAIESSRVESTPAPTVYIYTAVSSRQLPSASCTPEAPPFDPAALHLSLIPWVNYREASKTVEGVIYQNQLAHRSLECLICIEWSHAKVVLFTI